MLLLLLPPCCAVLQHPLLNISRICPREAGPRLAHRSWSGLGLSCLPVWLLQHAAGLHHLSTSLDDSLQVQDAARLSDSCSVHHVWVTGRHPVPDVRQGCRRTGCSYPSSKTHTLYAVILLVWLLFSCRV